MTAPNPLALALGLDIADILERLERLERLEQLGSSTIATGDDDAAPLVDVVTEAADLAADTPDLDGRLAEAEDAVAAATLLADAAREAGIAAGEAGEQAAVEAGEAADVALQRAQDARAAADQANNAIPAIEQAAAAADAKAIASGVAAGFAQATADGKNTTTYQAIPPAVNRLVDGSPTTGTNWGTAGNGQQSTGVVNLPTGPTAKAYRTVFAGGTAGWFVTPNESIPVTAGESITAQAWGRHTWDGQIARVTMLFDDAAGNFISGAYGPDTVMPKNVGTSITWSGVVPTGASRVRIYYDTNGGTQPGAGDTAYVAAIRVGPSNAVWGKTVGDQWFIRSSVTGIVTGFYEWDGNYWQQRVLDNATIANLDAAKITSGFIAADRIAANTITSAMIAAATILASNIAADTLTSREIAADAITAAELAADAILARNIKAGEITAGKLAAASVAAANIIAASITGDKLVANTITAREILAGSITADLLSANAIDGKTITGALFRTAASGARIEIQQSSTAVPGGAIQFIASGGSAPNIVKLVPGGLAALTVQYGSLSSFSNIAAFEAYSPTPNDPYFNAPTSALQGMRAVDSHSLYLPDTDGPWGSIKVKKAVIESITHPVSGRVLVGDTGWITPTVANATQDATNPIRFRLLNGFVVFDGFLGLTSASLNATIFNLPLGFRPAVAREVWVNRGSATQWIVRIQSGGNVALLGPSGGSGSLQFASIPPYPADN